MIHLSTLKAAVLRPFQKHAEALGLQHIDFRIVSGKGMP